VPYAHHQHKAHRAFEKAPEALYLSPHFSIVPSRWEIAKRSIAVFEEKRMEDISLRDRPFSTSERLVRHWPLHLAGIFGLLGLIHILQFFPVLPFFYPSLLLYRGVGVLHWVLAYSFFFWWGRREEREHRMRQGMHLISGVLTALFGLLILMMCGLSMQALYSCPGFCQYTPKASLVVDGSTYHVASTESWDDTLTQEDFFLYQCDLSGLWCHEVKKVGSITHSDASNKYPYHPSTVSVRVVDHRLLIEYAYGSEEMVGEYPLPERALSK
jgi:hypothetical protein